MSSCAYCGVTEGKLTRDHVIPSCLYPPSKYTSKVQRLTVPACDRCNGSWADDEPHFKSMLELAGDSNAVVKELFPITLRSFEKEDGERRLEDLYQQMKPIATAEGQRNMVFLGDNHRVMRVVKKVIRGLSYHHRVLWPVSEEQVFADVLKYVVPQELLDIMQVQDRDKDVIEYRYGRHGIWNSMGIHSIWLLTFVRRTTFIGVVLTSEEGYPQDAAKEKEGI